MVYTQSLTEQYKKLKLQNPEHILLMQVGAFMQVIDKDARTVSGVTGLKLKMGLYSDLNNGTICPFPEKCLKQLRQTIVSYMAHFIKANYHNLIYSILEKYSCQSLSIEP